MNRTVEHVTNIGLCSGCGTCAGLCPHSAIKMERTKDAYIAKVDKQKCKKCGFCYSVCPGLSVDFRKLNLEIFGEETKEPVGNYTNCYMGHTTDVDMRSISASGGLVSSLLVFALEEGIIDGAIVTRMNKENPITPEVFIARNRNDVIQAAKSKYCPIPVNSALQEILKTDEKFAVVGLPCHIEGIRKAEMIKKDLAKKIVFRFGLICNHAPTFLATEYILQKMNICKKDVEKIEYRSRGWPGGLSVRLKNGDTKFAKIDSFYYWGHVFNNYFTMTRCILCNDKICEFADISFGDAWLPELQNSKLGESVIISRTEIGQKLIENALLKEKIELKKVSCNKVIESQALDEVKKRLEARFFVSRMLGKQVPTYNQKFLKSGVRAYFSAMLVFSRAFISSKQSLWKFIDTYPFFLRGIRRKPYESDNIK